jgi:hypothetical protein
VPVGQVSPPQHPKVVGHAPACAAGRQIAHESSPADIIAAATPSFNPSPLPCTHPPTHPPPQAGIELPPEAAARTRFHLHPSCLRFEPLPPDPLTGAPRVDVTVLVAFDMTKVPVPDSIISFLLKVRPGQGWLRIGGAERGLG